MKKIAVLSIAVLGTLNAVGQNGGSQLKTFCNPLNLPYNFQTPDVTRREAADPAVVMYHNKYWLFASKQAGYWWSDDLLNWHFVKPEGLPLDVYAPAAAVVNDQLIYFAGDRKGAYSSPDPAKGKWTNINPFTQGSSDPDLFADNGKTYLFDGCSDKTPVRVTELDPKTFLPVGAPIPAFSGDPLHHGWEVSGDINRGRKENDMSPKSQAPWVEGSWVNKINGKYYWQYAAPGTQYKSYADGVYVSDSPAGPYTYQDYSPFSFKPTGFIAGAGHSSTFEDRDGDYWHIGTGTISVRHVFERRLVLFPTAILPDGQLVTNTYLGDYPQYAPGTAKDHLLGNITPWMLLSLDKPATASSTLESTDKQNFALANAFDENIQTWWSAKTGNPGEWLQVDLKKPCRINAIQVNFADQGAKHAGQLTGDGYEYLIEASQDGKSWKTIVDRSAEMKDTPHDYTQLISPAMARYVRLKNVHCPADGLFSIYDLRIFGSALGKLPPPVKSFSVSRDEADKRRVKIKWSPNSNTDFYIVRYGIAPHKLFSSYQVYRNAEVEINALNVDVGYFFTVDAVNGSGITQGKSPAKTDEVR